MCTTKARFTYQYLVTYSSLLLSLKVSDLPDNHPTYPSYGGARAMPTLTGDGIILQHKQYFYQLNCDQNTCSWEILEEELSEPAHYGATMILPAKYTCL